MKFPLISKRMMKIHYFFMILNAVFFLSLLSLAIAQDVRNDDLQISFYVFVVVFLVLFLWIINNMQIRIWGGKDGKIIIDENGIDYTTDKKHITMEWNQVEYVVIAKVRKTFTIRFFTCFAESAQTKMPYIIDPRFNASHASSDFVLMPYSKQALDEVKKHFDKSITDEYKLYLKRVGL